MVSPSSDRARIERAVRSAAWKARVAADPTILTPIPHDPDHAARVALHARLVRRGATTAPAPWPRWGLAEAYVAAEINRSHRTLAFCAGLVYQTAARLGGISILCD